MTARAAGDRRRRTVWTLAALGAGVLAGTLLREALPPAAESLARWIASIGQLWIAALQLLVLPLVITSTFASIAGGAGESRIGKLGVQAIALFVAMLLVASLLTLPVASLAVSLYPIDTGAVASLRSETAAPPAGQSASGFSLASWLTSLVPRNVFQSAASGEILPVLIFTVLLALAARRLAPDARATVTAVFRALADATLVLVGWVLAFAPVGVFALSFDMSRRIGLHAAGFVAAFLVLTCGALLVFTALLNPVTAVLGRTSVRRFARAVAPAQLVAVSSRSSLASLPALVDGAKRHLALPASATAFVLPLCVSLFRVSSAVSSPVRLLLLARVYGLHLDLAQIATFIVTVAVLTFSYAGVASGAFMQSLPAYVAAGVPLEGFLILETVDTVVDVFQTLGNVTADMSVATILSRSERAESSA